MAGDSDPNEAAGEQKNAATHQESKHKNGGRQWFSSLPWEGIGRTIEVIGTIVSGIVAAVALVISLNSRDMQAAIGKLSDLASQTKRQADALNKQLGQVKREADAAQSQILILAKQFSQMKLQTKAFQQSALAAEGQLSEMQEMQSAVVTVGRVQFIKSDQFGQKEWTVQIFLQNSGHLPTYNLAVYTGIIPIQGTSLIHIGPPEKSRLPSHVPDPRTLITQHRGIPFHASLGPHVDMPVAHLSIPEQALKTSVTDGVMQAIYGIATYADNARPNLQHETMFCFTLGLGGVLIEHGTIRGGKFSGKESVSPSINLCPHWNCTDSECKDDERHYDDAVDRRQKATMKAPLGHF